MITNKLIKLKRSLCTRNELDSIASKKVMGLIQKTKKELTKKFKIKIEYLECRNLMTITTNLKNKPFKLFVAYYLNEVRLIDNF